MDTSKIIIGTVGGGRYTVTAPIVKEDYGLYLKIEGLELPSTYEVDFSNSEHNGTSVTMIGNSDGVLIPSQFISSGKDVFAFLYHVGVDYGRTVYKFRIPNKLRPDRTDETPTPEEQSTIDQAISALNSAVAQTAQDKADADVSAQNASADAERAEEARTDAQNYADGAEQAKDDAQTYANNASASATASAQSAEQSAINSADAQDSAEEAKDSATASANSATASANSASQASASAQSASGYASQTQASAQTASSKASEASGYASTASAKATEATQSASQALSYKTDAEQAKTASQTAQGLAESARDSAITAKNDAESARDDAVQAKEDAESAVASIADALDDKAPVITDTASGSIASFSDGADDLPLKSLVVDINPIQDLHGQDSPYPAGGGKNLLKNNLTSQTQNGITVSVDSQGIITLTGTATVQTQFDINTDIGIGAGNYILSGISNGSATTFKLEAKVDGSWGVNLFNGERSLSVVTGIERLVIIVYNGVSLSNVQIKPMIRLSTVTDATYSPYENLCPISGWTEVDVEQRGVNLFDGNSFVSGRYDNADFSISSASDTRNAKIYLKAGSYTLSANGTSSINRRILNGAMSSAIRNLPMSFTLSADGWFGFSTTDLTSDFKLELGSTATPYEPYTGRSININLGQTVYGGKLDVLSGELVIDRAMVDLGSLDWSTYSLASNCFKAILSDGKVTRTNYSADGICSLYAKANYITTLRDTDSTFGVGYSNLSTAVCHVAVHDSRFTDATVFKTAMSGVQLVYELAEPIEIQLTPHEVNSLLGVNNIFADTGDSAVEYRADTTLYIQRLTEPDADMIADSNITSGSYFMVGNSLFKATANIASGSAVVVGTNATRKSLAQALNEINA